MAAISSNGTGGGNYSAGASWVGGVAPTNVDDVTVVSGDTITIDAANACNSFISNSGSTITCNKSANTSLTTETGITISGDYDFDMSSSSNTLDLILNNSRTSGSTTKIYTTSGSSGAIKGLNRKRLTNLDGSVSSGAESATVDDATGWIVGDIVVFGTTQAYDGTHKVDVVTLTSVSGNDIGWSGGLSYDHADNGRVGNFSSNVTIKPSVSGDASGFQARGDAELSQIAFQGLNNSGSPVYGLALHPALDTEYNDCAFYNFVHRAVSLIGDYNKVTTRNFVYYSPTVSGNVVGLYTTTRSGIEAIDNHVFRAYYGMLSSSPGMVINGGSASACTSGYYLQGINAKLTNVDLHSNEYDLFLNSVSCTIQSGALGTSYNAASKYNYYLRYTVYGLSANCTHNSTTSTMYHSSILSDDSYLTLANKNNDATLQETYTSQSATIPTVEWDSSSGYGGDPCWIINTTTASRTIEIPWSAAAVNDKVTLVTGRVKRTNGQPVTITFSGLGLIADTYTCSGANDTWEQFDIQLTNDTGNNGVLDVVVEVTSGNAGVVYISDFTQPPSEAINTGNMSYAQDGLPVSLILGNFTSAADIANYQTSEATVAGSWLKLLVDLDGKVDAIDDIVDAIFLDTDVIIPALIDDLNDLSSADIQAAMEAQGYVANIEGGYSHQALMRLIVAILLNKLSGVDPSQSENTIIARDIADSKNRVSGIVDRYGNRIGPIILDPTD
jgi:hypothetical protein